MSVRAEYHKDATEEIHEWRRDHHGHGVIAQADMLPEPGADPLEAAIGDMVAAWHETSESMFLDDVMRAVGRVAAPHIERAERFKVAEALRRAAIAMENGATAGFSDESLAIIVGGAQTCRRMADNLESIPLGGAAAAQTGADR